MYKTVARRRQLYSSGIRWTDKNLFGSACMKFKLCKTRPRPKSQIVWKKTDWVFKEQHPNHAIYFLLEPVMKWKSSPNSINFGKK